TSEVQARLGLFGSGSHQERDLLYFTITTRSVGKNSTDERNSYLSLAQSPGWEKTIPMSGIVIYA
ncbi:hypothetical protein, partial [Phormidium sp. CCY1219]|uniref:hypothetical protein n=1 Tax=Phormidium sp. CCY1219 TaxID=2886104 RepID=UPI002D1EC8EA